MQINNLLFIQAKYCSKHNILACNMHNMHKIHAYKKKLLCLPYDAKSSFLC